MLRRTIPLLLVLAAAAGAAPETSRRQRPGEHAFSTATFEWRDEARQRDVPVKVYFPEATPGPFPLIVFSHGAGGSRDGYEYLGSHWASHGYIVVNPQHKGSDVDVWRGRADPLQGIRESIRNPKNAIDRPGDIAFVIDRITEMNEGPGQLQGRVDLERIGVGGHSFGAWTTLAVAGQTFPVGRRTITYRDERVKAAIPMSAPVPRRKETHAQAFGNVRIPCLHMTGTLDKSIVSETTPEQRRIPFDNMDAADQYLVTFTGGDHMIFSGRGRLRGGEKDAMFQELIKAGTTAFWDAYLRDDPEAGAWLAEGGYEAALGADAILETKLSHDDTT